MKKGKAWMVFLLVNAILLSGCSTVIENSGIENFNTMDCSDELTRYLFPDDEYINMFEFIKADYNYYCIDNWKAGDAIAFAYLTYDVDEYEMAKEFCLDNFKLCDKHQYEYGNYIFCEHLCHRAKSTSDEIIIACRFPEKFNMFAYNDKTQTLFFIGYYIWGDCTESIQSSNDSFCEFLLSTYSKYYSFE